MKVDPSDLIRFPRNMGRPLAGWRVFCPGCSYSRVFTATQAAEVDGGVSIKAFACAQCGVSVEVDAVPISETGTITGCCKRA